MGDIRAHLPRTRSYVPLSSSPPQEIESSYKRRRSILAEEKQFREFIKLPVIGRISSYSVAGGYSLRGLLSFLQSNNYQPILKKETISFQPKGGSADVIFFSYGVVVFWSLTVEEEREFLSQTDTFRVDPVDTIEFDHFEFEYSDKGGISMDRVQIENKDHFLKVAISVAIAQSAKLCTFEDEVEDIVSKTKDLPQELASKGRVSLSRKQLSQKMGELFIEKNKVFLQSSILDKPDFLWEFQQYDEMYTQVSGYLDIKSRTKILNIKFSVVQELFDMLRSESISRSSQRQEWIVIILIFVELIFLILETSVDFIVQWLKS